MIIYIITLAQHQQIQSIYLLALSLSHFHSLLSLSRSSFSLLSPSSFSPLSLYPTVMYFAFTRPQALSHQATSSLSLSLARSLARSLALLRGYRHGVSATHKQTRLLSHPWTLQADDESFI